MWDMECETWNMEFCMVWYGMVWYGMVWYGMVRYGMVWYGMVWYDLDHVAGWESYNLEDLAHVSRVGSVLYRSCTSSHDGRLGSR